MDRGYDIEGQPARLFVGETPFREVPKRIIGVSSNGEILLWKDKHKGGRCILVANGESAKSADLTRVPRDGPNRVWTIGLNRAWELGDWDYHAMGDQRQFQFHEEMRGDCKALEPLFTTHASGRQIGTRIWGRTSDMKYFSFDATEGFYLNNTITAYGFQLAVWMGFATIYLIGVDAKGRHFYGGDVIGAMKFANQRETLGLFAGILRERRPDINVVNLNIDSHVRVFQKKRFAEVFA